MPQDAGAFGLRRFTQIDHRTSTTSTNDDAQPRLGEPGAAGLVIVADVQTGGVGRHGRRWISPVRSGLLFTAILPEPIRTDAAWAVTLWSGLAVQRALRRRNVGATLQWPNDLLVDARKICGILCISRIAGAQAWIGCGVGLNVFRPEHHPELETIEPAPIFLDDVAVLGTDARIELLIEILKAFENDLDALRDPEAIARRWERAAGLPGTRYRLSIEGEGQLEAEAVRIATGGGLVINAGGSERTIDLADARVVR